MKLRPKTAISEFFSDIKDPRVERHKRHKLIDIITITICAVISGIEHWTEIQSYGETKYKWCNCSPQQKSLIEKHYKQHQLSQQKYKPCDLA